MDNRKQNELAANRNDLPAVGNSHPNETGWPQC
jgi:hypothetical protein